jgi:hypothetical protein
MAGDPKTLTAVGGSPLITPEELADLIAAGQPIPAAALALRRGQRAMLAAQAEAILAHRRDAKRQVVSKHRAKVRAATPSAERQPCYVCGKYRPITQRHHLKPVGTQTPADPIDTRFVWLCPNCHTIFHAFLAGAEATVEFAGMLTAPQWAAIGRVHNGTAEAK